ncbi:MAG: RnfABCDGE type electron transport complex subunit A [Ruminococcaceae bacterium]|nr:RnfABCDGE type electron transport complex subunit A [Oscillospiraceae bacterium]MBQ7391719.1 RnfABCDGE type electron transport complex subunit A [Clostridia bacterium]
MTFGSIMTLMFTALLVENFIFSKFYGCCPFLGVSEKPDTALGMGMAVTFVITTASAVTWAVYTFLLAPFGLDYLKTIAFILVIAALVQFIEMFLRKFIPALYNSLGIYLPLITTNCAVLSCALLIVQNEYNLLQAVCFGFAASLGFTLAIVVFAGVRVRMENADPPRAFRGFPLTLITAGLLAMAFSCFSGVNL